MRKLLIGCATAFAVTTAMAGLAAADDGALVRLSAGQLDAISAGALVFGGSNYTAAAGGIPFLGGVLPAYTQGESNTEATANGGGGQIVTYAWAAAFGTGAAADANSVKDPVSIGVTGKRTFNITPLLQISYSYAGGAQPKYF